MILSHLRDATWTLKTVTRHCYDPNESRAVQRMFVICVSVSVFFKACFSI